MSAKINTRLAILLGLSLLLMPFANALTVNDFFQNFYGLVENQYAFYTIMFLVTFIFLFSIFFGLTKYIPFFKGSGGNVSPGGQIFALSLSAGATLAFFSYIQGRGGAGYASGFFTNRVGSWGIWGWILLALLILAVVFFAFKKGKGFGFGGGEGGEGGNLKGLTALLWVLSFILVMYGSISKNRTITTIGAVLFVIALILTALTGGFKFGEGKEEGGKGPGEDKGRDKESDEWPEGELDFTKPTDVGFYVTDLESLPLQNARVIVKGKSRGKKLKWKFATNDKGETEIQSLPSGYVIIEVMHRNHKWYWPWAKWQHQAGPRKGWLVPLFPTPGTKIKNGFLLDPAKDNRRIPLTIRTRRNWRPAILGHQSENVDNEILRVGGKVIHWER